MSAKKISIIIPVDNAQNYLYETLNSILAQMFTNWECILIDDGSSDCSGKICDEYAEQDSRFQEFHKKNGGVSFARNMGLSKAAAEGYDWLNFEKKQLPNYSGDRRLSALAKVICSLEQNVVFSSWA